MIRNGKHFLFSKIIKLNRLVKEQAAVIVFFKYILKLCLKKCIPIGQGNANGRRSIYDFDYNDDDHDEDIPSDITYETSKKIYIKKPYLNLHFNPFFKRNTVNYFNFVCIIFEL